MCIILLLKCIYYTDVFDIKSFNNMASSRFICTTTHRYTVQPKQCSNKKRAQLDGDRIQNSCFFSYVLSRLRYNIITVIN